MTTIKTIKLKKTPVEAPAVAPPEPSGQDAALEIPAAAEPAVAPPPGLEPVSAASHAGSGKFALFAIFGIVATLAVLAVIGLQYAELAFFKASPSVWPQ
jgi:hypothetical protein